MTNYYRAGSAPVRVIWSREEEIRLHRRAKRSAEAREAFISMFLLYAAQVGQKAATGRLKNDEALSAANQGLVRAMRRWDSKSGTRFSTFARKFIRGAVLSEIRRESIRGSRFVSVEDPHYDRPAEDVSEDCPRNNAEASDFRRSAGGALLKKVVRTCLNAQERRVIQLRFDKDLNFQQIGERMGFRRQRAQQILVKALARLKEAYGPRFRRRSRI